jgi:uncharacterized protein YoxC
MTELEKELLAALQTTRQAELQTVAELTADVKQMSYVLTTFADALLDMAEGNREANQRAREIFRAIKEQGEPHGDSTETAR